MHFYYTEGNLSMKPIPQINNNSINPHYLFINVKQMLGALSLSDCVKDRLQAVQEGVLQNQLPVPVSLGGADLTDVVYVLREDRHSLVHLICESK